MTKKPEPSFAPIYCGMYPDLAKLARRHGYALAIHGSLQRDFDLVCIPWVDKPSEPREVVDEMASVYALKVIGDPTIAAHGREVWTIAISFGECFLDLSFMPRHPTQINEITDEK